MSSSQPVSTSERSPASRTKNFQLDRIPPAPASTTSRKESLGVKLEKRHKYDYAASTKETTLVSFSLFHSWPICRISLPKSTPLPTTFAMKIGGTPCSRKTRSALSTSTLSKKDCFSMRNWNELATVAIFARCIPIEANSVSINTSELKFSVPTGSLRPAKTIPEGAMLVESSMSP
jgi:hypothetical protein